MQSLVHTPTNRAQQYISRAEDSKSELAHVHNGLRANGLGAFNPHPAMLGIAYVVGSSEQLGQIYKSHNVQMYHKPTNFLRLMIVHPKDKTLKEHRCRTISYVTTTAATHTLVIQRDHSARGSNHPQTWTNQQE